MKTNPFASVESALEFLTLLDEAIAETKVDLKLDLGSEDDNPRRNEALLLALHKLERLEFHVARSRRMANDLRTLRRLLQHERSKGVAVGAPVAES